MDNFQLDFLGIGTIKSGSSLLADLMMQHPQIQWASRKELNYFNSFQADGSPNPYYHQPFSFYRHFFYDSLSPGKKQGEYSPIYMADPLAIKKIHSLFPNTRLIVSLRNPVNRAYSHFLYSRDFLQTIPKDCPFDQAIEKYPYLIDLGMYGEQLRQLFSVFPPSQCIILIFEEMIQDPVSTAQEIYRHINVDDNFRPQVQKVNESKRIRYQWMEKALTFISHIKSRLGNGLTQRMYNSPLYPVLLKWKHWIRDRNTQSVKKSPLPPETYKLLFKKYEEDIEQTKLLLNRKNIPWF